MNETPNIVRVASLIGDNARAEVLSALMAGRALTATELADIAGVTKQTISSHLGKLLDGGLLTYEQQGRHRYFKLATPDVAHLLESMMGVAQNAMAPGRRFGPRQPALRKARSCYDHLAGELAVRAYEALVENGVLVEGGETLKIADHGHDWFQDIGIDTAQNVDNRRAQCRSCLDWSERRRHLAGVLGAAFFARIQELGWAKRTPGSRVVTFSPQGEKSFLALFD